MAGLRSALAVALVLALAPAAALGAFGPPPAPRAEAYVLVEPRTGEVLAAEQPGRALPMASTTKMMTALVVRERAGLDDQVVVPGTSLDDDVVSQLVPGERLAVRDLLEILLIGSENRAAVALAEHVAGSEAEFVALMNARAREMGLEDTSFANPHGLDAPGHRASAADLAAIAEELMADDVLAEIVSRRRGSIPGEGGGAERAFESHNLLLDMDADADGVKTGMTGDAGYTLAAHAEREDLGVELYAVLLGSPGDVERAEDAEALLDWGFAQYARPTLLGVEQTLGEVDVTDRPGRALPLRVETPLVATVRLDEPIEQRLLVPPRVEAPIAEGERVGVVVYRQGGRRLGRAPVVVAAGADAPTLVDRVRSGWDRLIA